VRYGRRDRKRSGDDSIGVGRVGGAMGRSTVGDRHDGVETIGVNCGGNEADGEAVLARECRNFFLIVPVAHRIKTEKAADGGFEEMLPAIAGGIVVGARVVEAAAVFVENAAADELRVRMHHAASVGDVVGKHLRVKVLDDAIGKN